mgnify:CR=1 FL=1
MNKIQEVKERADIIKVAEYYGLKLDRAYKCVCPFHKEKTASLSVSPSKQIWKCFGCGAGGDAINLLEKLLNINAYESAKRINEILNLGIDFGRKSSNIEITKYEQKQKAKEQFKKWEERTFKILCQYLHSLQGIKKYQEQDKIEYYIDFFINGTEEDKLWFKKNNSKVVQKIEEELRRGNIIRV